MSLCSTDLDLVLSVALEEAWVGAPRLVEVVRQEQRVECEQ
jgi:hypothetical protein